MNRFLLYLHINSSDENKEHAFNEIWKKYYQRLYVFIQPIVKENTADVLQTVMLKVFQNLDKYNPVYSFSTWIYTIARNCALNHAVKKQINVDYSSEPDLHGAEENFEQQYLCKEELLLITSFLQSLPELHQQIAFLRFFEGFSISEIAAIVDIPAGTVKSRLYYLRKELKHIIEANDEK